MISIIVCSVNIEYFDRLKENIQSTIGTEYELIRIDNSNNNYSICQAYNIGALKSQYDILCFLHEDITFKTYNWGKILLDHFQDQTMGLIGVAGSQYKTKTISGWWASNTLAKIKLIQGNKNNPTFSQEINKDASGYEFCVCIDGVFMCTSRKIWQKIQFDDTTLKKFHCYDLDYSLAVFEKGYKVIVCYDIFLEHFSAGGYDKIWYEETLKLHKKWQSKLPLSTSGISQQDKVNAEWETKKNITRFLVQNKYPLSTILKNIFGKMYSFSLKKCLICIIEIYKARKESQIAPNQ